MSTRAYKLIKIDHESEPAFNWTHDIGWLSELDGIRTNADETIMQITVDNADTARLALTTLYGAMLTARQQADEYKALSVRYEDELSLLR